MQPGHPQPILPHATPGRLQRRSVSRRIHGGSFSSDACSAPSHVRQISIFVPWIVLWPKEVAAVGGRGMGVGTARKHAKHASTQVRKYIQQAVSTPVKHKSPHPAHSHAHMLKNTHKSTCAGSGPLWFPLLHLVTPGSYTGAGIHGGSPGDGLLGTDHGPKTSKKPACVNMCKQARQIRHGCSGPDVPGCLCSEEAAPRM